MTNSQLVEAAAKFAAAAHGEQRYGKPGVPYATHLANVVDVLSRFGFGGDEELLAAGWLHDVLEDTSVTHQELADRFGCGVAALVLAVTDQPGKNRWERHALTYPPLREAGPRAVALKLADRIANVEYSASPAGGADDGKLRMYRVEHSDFYGYLHRAGEHGEMWKHLDSLLRVQATDSDLNLLLYNQGLSLGFTGHRPDKLAPYERPVRRHLERVICAAKPHEVVSGMALGLDTWAAEEALRVGVPLVAAVPFVGHDARWSADDKRRYERVLARAARVQVVYDGPYHPSKMQARNEWLVDHCDLLVGYWDRSSGGTRNCLAYAERVKRTRLIIYPRALVPASGDPLT